MKRILSMAAMLLLSTGVFAAGVSTTNFSGSGSSLTYTVGGHSNTTAYAGSTGAFETGQGVISISGTLYSGSTIDSGAFQEISVSNSQFSGVATNDGLVGRTVQHSETFTSTGGIATNSLSANETGITGEFSAVGNGFNGTVGSEGGVYSNSSFENSYTVYGSNSYADTYSTTSYDL